MNIYDLNSTRRDAFGDYDPAVLEYGQFSIVVNATNEFTNNDVNKGLIRISLDYEPDKTDNLLLMSMVYFSIIVLLMVSILSLVYLTYRQ